MSGKHHSIGERMQRAKSLERRVEVATAWAINWQDEYDDLIRRLERAVSSRDFDAVARVAGELKAVGEKRFGGLQKVVDALADDDVL